MTTKDDGGLAFPSMQRVNVSAPELGPNIGRTEVHPMGGMTLRDWFAGQAMEVVIRVATLPGAGKHGGGSINENDIASSAYALADAMLAERSK